MPSSLAHAVLIIAGEYPASAASSIILQPCNRQLSSQQENIRPPQPPLSSSSPAIDSCHHSRRISGLKLLLTRPLAFLQEFCCPPSADLCLVTTTRVEQRLAHPKLLSLPPTSFFQAFCYSVTPSADLSLITTTRVEQRLARLKLLSGLLVSGALLLLLLLQLGRRRVHLQQQTVRLVRTGTNLKIYIPHRATLFLFFNFP